MLTPTLERLPRSKGLIGWRRKRPEAFLFDWHFHPELELTLILAGRGKRFVGSHIGPYAGGDLVLVGANVPHTWMSSTEGGDQHEAVVIHFPRDLLGPGSLDRAEMASIDRLLSSSVCGIRFLGDTAN